MFSTVACLLVVVVVVVSLDSSWAFRRHNTMRRKPHPSPGKVTVDLFCPLWWVANKSEVGQTLVSTDHAVGSLERKFALSERWRCETKPENKWVMVDWVARYSSPRGRSVQPLLCIILIQGRSCPDWTTSNAPDWLFNLRNRQKRAPEYPRGVQRKKKTRQATVENIFISVHILAWETCGQTYFSWVLTWRLDTISRAFLANRC